MKKIKELIVVEGKNDYNKLKNIIDAEIIVTNGTHLGYKVLNYIEEAVEKKGVIIFTDPDAPGEMIRSKINEKVKNCKNAFLPQKKAIGKKKIGIEHAEDSDILLSLEKLVTYTDRIETIRIVDLIELGLNGSVNSKELRKKVGEHFGIGDTNAKMLLKRLNFLGISKEDIEELL